MKQCDYFWSGFNTQQDQKNNDRVQLAVWEIEAAKSKEQAKRNLIDLWLGVDAQLAFQSWLHEQSN